MVRVKRRYVLLKINLEAKNKNKLNQEEFITELKERITQTYGDFGIACFERGYSLKKVDLNDGIILLMIRRGCEQMVMSVLPLITSISHIRSQILILHLSGTMRSSLKHWKLHSLTELRRSIGQRASTIK